MHHDQVARERRAEAECRRESWALSQMTGGRAREVAGGGGQGVSGGGSSAPNNGNGGNRDEEGWELPGPLDQLARLLGTQGRYDAGLGGVEVDVGSLRGGRREGTEAWMSVVVEKEEACKV